MIEKRIYQYLKGKTDIPVSFEKTSEPPYYLLEKTGTGVENHIITSTIVIQSYGRSLLEAMELNEAVKEFMDDFITEGDISESKLVNDHNFTDTVKKKYRYQCIYNIVHR